MNDELIKEVPEPEDYSKKEVYAFYGLCSFYAQVLEQGVVNLAVGLRIRGVTALQQNDIEAIFDKADKKTLGQLLHDIRKKVEITTEAEYLLRKALENRNYLFHRFFVKHDINFGSDPGRRDMIAELRLMTKHFQKTDQLLDKVWMPLWNKLGLTQELLDAELKRMRDEASQREASG